MVYARAGRKRKRWRSAVVAAKKRSESEVVGAQRAVLPIGLVAFVFAIDTVCGALFSASRCMPERMRHRALLREQQQNYATELH